MEACDHVCKGDGNCNPDVLVALLQDKEELLNAAGECGLKMHEQLQESQHYMEEQRIQHEKQLEEKIQETYELKIKLECSERSLEDSKIISRHAIEDCKISNEKLVDELSQKVNILKKEKTNVLAQLNQAQLLERQLNERIEQLEDKNSNLIAEKQKKRKEVDISYSQELFVLHEQVITLEEAQDVSRSEELILKNKIETLSLSLQTLQGELDDKVNEVEAAEQKNTSLFNHLEKSREETTEVKAELDALKVQLQQKGHLKKGNSLFGEVEDERMMMEKKLKTMEVRYESLTKAHSFLKSQHHSLKSQVTALLSLHSGKADLDHINNLERTVSQLKSENAELVNKIRSMQVNITAGENLETLKELGKKLPNIEGNKEMVEFLTIQLEELKEENKKLHSELNQVHMVKMSESDKLHSAEQKLHDIGLTSEKYRNVNMNLRLKLEESESKYKAENQKRILIEKKFNYDSSNDVEPIGISNQKDRSPPPFVKRQQQQNKFNQTTTKKSKPAYNIKAMEWSDVVKTLKESQKLLQKEKQDLVLENDTVTPHERKVSFKDGTDVFSPPLEKKYDSEKGEERPLKETEIKSEPSSCLKKSNVNTKSTFSMKESNKNISNTHKFNLNVAEKEEESCGVQ